MAEDKDKKEESQKDTAENKKSSESSNDTKGCGWGCLCAVIIIVIGIFAFNSCKRHNEETTRQVEQSEKREKKKDDQKKKDIKALNKDINKAIKYGQDLSTKGKDDDYNWTTYIEGAHFNYNDLGSGANVIVANDFENLSNHQRFEVADSLNSAITTLAIKHHISAKDDYNKGTFLTFYNENGTQIGRSKIGEAKSYKWSDN